jgi:geranylgeranyl reductase family protein
MTYDVVVVGAGPSGTAAARTCAEHGLATLCIEEHGTIGYPVQCAGLLSNAAFAECRVTEKPVLNRVEGARIISKTGSTITIDTKSKKAYVVDRGALDFEMAAAAAGAGAEFRLRTAAYRIKNNVLLTRGVQGHEEIPFRILIAADGPRSTIARLSGMKRSPVYLSGIQADMPYDCDPRFVEIHPDASPEFFGWVIPTAQNRIRIGLCGQSYVPERFAAFAREFGTTTTHLVTGTLPLGIMPKTYGNRILYVGDAAGFPKPTSGGGVYTGIRSARHAATVAVRALEQDSFDDAVLSDYERLWKEDMGRELELGFRLFALRKKMRTGEIDTIIRTLNDPEVLAAIVQYGDIDRPGTLVRELMKKPAVFSLIGPLLKTGIRSLLG